VSDSHLKDAHTEVQRSEGACHGSVSDKCRGSPAFHASSIYPGQRLLYKNPETETSPTAYSYPMLLHLLLICLLLNHSHSSPPTISLVTHDKRAQRQVHGEAPIKRKLAPSWPRDFTSFAESPGHNDESKESCLLAHKIRWRLPPNACRARKLMDRGKAGQRDCIGNGGDLSSQKKAGPCQEGNHPSAPANCGHVRMQGCR